MAAQTNPDERMSFPLGGVSTRTRSRDVQSERSVAPASSDASEAVNSACNRQAETTSPPETSTPSSTEQNVAVTSDQEVEPSRVKRRPKTSAERTRKYRERKKLAAKNLEAQGSSADQNAAASLNKVEPIKVPKTPAERARDYRVRMKMALLRRISQNKFIFPLASTCPEPPLSTTRDSLTPAGLKLTTAQGGEVETVPKSEGQLGCGSKSSSGHRRARRNQDKFYYDENEETNDTDTKLSLEELVAKHGGEGDSKEQQSAQTDGGLKRKLHADDGDEQSELNGSEQAEDEASASASKQQRRDRHDLSLWLQPSDDCISFGRYIADKLHNYSWNTRTAVQHAISEIVFSADQGRFDAYCEDYNAEPTKPSQANGSAQGRDDAELPRDVELPQPELMETHLDESCET